MCMDVVELERLVEIVRKANIRELTLRQGESRITLKKTAPITGPAGALVPYVHGMVVTQYEEYEADQSDEDGATGAESHWILSTVTAPLVGVYHHVKPLVGLGAKVTGGQVIGVIEAMKLVTEVVSPIDGVVIETLIEEGMPVEYGQPLFVIQPDLRVS